MHGHLSTDQYQEAVFFGDSNEFLRIEDFFKSFFDPDSKVGPTPFPSISPFKRVSVHVYSGNSVRASTHKRHM